ncbi:hypothetical protein SAMN04489726_4658 [Allokutzneria albata]|uniref:DUF5753 domain-containing protein n=1 Tax=Allokutzneria albata TaxID=211114 RepID=A0A1G9Y821_ALLAB|nr:hypothetical protein SAMN04489726_4658 [Allokutzneria albata]
MKQHRKALSISGSQISRSELAQLNNSQADSYGKIERGERKITEDHLRKVMARLKLNEEECSLLWRLRFPLIPRNDWSGELRHIANHFRVPAEQEWHARRIIGCHEVRLPGVLHDVAFMRQQFMSDPANTPEMIEARVKHRLERRGTLTKRPAIEHHYIICEPTLDNVCRLPDSDISRAQLLFLIDSIKKYENLTVQLLPARCGAPDRSKDQMIYLFKEDVGNFVYYETGPNSICCPEREKVAGALDFAETLASLALSPEDTLGCILDLFHGLR